ncbi:hypothetical protein HDU82_003359 [Entophlyctis luteolus]|nr:hypothetical protein HDU82_003359 [Entophlyctis luteolus]
MDRAFVTFSFVAEDAERDVLLSRYDAARVFILMRGESVGIAADTAPELLDQVQMELVRSMAGVNSETELSFSPPPDSPASTLSFVLYTTLCPKTVQNFLRLCDGTKGLGKSSRKPLHYLNTRVHRIVPGFIIQWGDIVKGDGSGGDSIYGGKFNDEAAGLKLPVRRGSLVMANSGKNSNTSQVFVVLSNDMEKLKKLVAGKHVVFGHVAGFGDDEMTNEIALENVKVMERLDAATEATEIVISRCGVL